MSSDIAISVKNLTKTYRLFDHPGDRVKQALTFGRIKFHREFTALKDVSFEVKKGETVGIIGRNGSGKSTLLQLICGILKPTSGSVTVNGRISALLELGSGFNPEFTGRENIYFQGAIMGFSKADMDGRVEDIVAFADIGEFIDQPVRTYSSGMFVRLAFATAIHSEPDILILDEILAVGDMVFQRKCFESLKRLLIKKKPAVILVSHEIRQIQRFCTQAVFLHDGKMVSAGSSTETCRLYIEQSNASMVEDRRLRETEHSRVSSSGEVELTEIKLVTEAGDTVDQINSGEPLRIRIRFRLLTSLTDAEFIVGTQAGDLMYLSSSSTKELQPARNFDPGEVMIECLIHHFPLAAGVYFIRFGIRESFRLLFAGEGLCPFVVLGDDLEGIRPARLLNLQTTWTLQGNA